MTKLRSDSAWGALSIEQQNRLEEWLFEQNLSLADVVERAKAEFGITASKTSLWRFTQTLARERMTDEFNEALATAAVADGQCGDMKTLRGGVVKLIGKKLLNSAVSPLQDSKELSRLAAILMLNEQQEIQRSWLELAREKYRFRASKAALQALPLLNDFNKEEEQRENDRIEMIKRKLFGDEVDYIEEPGVVPNAVWGKQMTEAMDSFD